MSISVPGVLWCMLTLFQPEGISDNGFILECALLIPGVEVLFLRARLPLLIWCADFVGMRAMTCCSFFLTSDLISRDVHSSMESWRSRPAGESEGPAPKMSPNEDAVLLMPVHVGEAYAHAWAAVTEVAAAQPSLESLTKWHESFKDWWTTWLK